MTASQDAVGTARGRRIVQLADPVDDTDAANKGYVDSTAAGGSPGAVRWLDLGIVAVGDLDTAPVTLYTPAAGELVTDVRIRDFVYTDVTDSLFGVFSGVRYGPIAWVGHNADNVRDAPAQAATGLGQLADNEGDISVQSFVRITAGDPLIAAFSAHDSGEQAALAWTANTAKDGTPVAVNVIGAAHIWTSQDSGNTGGSPPDFAGNIGGSVVDGDITWTDAYAIPAAGEARILVAVTTPDSYP